MISAVTNLSSVAVVALTLSGEAIGASREFKEAVASVIYERAGGRVAQLRAVCLKPKQFSCWNDGGVRLTRTVRWSCIPWQDCMDLSLRLHTGEFKPTIRANHYCHERCVKTWRKWERGGMKLVAVIEHHRFYQWERRSKTGAIP